MPESICLSLHGEEWYQQMNASFYGYPGISILVHTMVVKIFSMQKILHQLILAGLQSFCSIYAAPRGLENTNTNFKKSREFVMQLSRYWECWNKSWMSYTRWQNNNEAFTHAVGLLNNFIACHVAELINIPSTWCKCRLVLYRLECYCNLCLSSWHAVQNKIITPSAVFLQCWLLC